MARSSTTTASTPSTRSSPEASARAGRWARPPRWAAWELSALFALVLLGLILRFSGYADTPAASANADEWAFGWGGLTLWTNGIPTGWSYLPAYAGRVHVIHLHGTGYPLITPWLDHPPLFALLTGLAPWLAGQHSLAAVTTSAIRLPAVLLGTASIGLLQASGRRVVGPTGAALGAAVLAFAPAAVLFSREVEAEALLAPLILVTIWLLHRLGTGEGSAPALAGVLLVCFLAVLTKIPGLAIGGFAFGVLLHLRRPGAAAGALAATAAGLGAYALYGAHYDWHLFSAVIGAQSSRRSGVMGAYEFIVSPAGVNQRLRDGWWVVGWIGIAAAMSGRRSPRAWLLTWPAAAYLVAIMVFADERVTSRYGWYHIAVYPLVYLAAGYVLWRAIRSPEPVAWTLILALGGATAVNLWLGSPWLPGGAVLIVVLVLALGPSLAAAAWPERRPVLLIARTVNATVTGLMLLGLIAESVNLKDNFLLF